MARSGVVALQPSTLRAVRRAGGGRRRRRIRGHRSLLLEYERLRDEEGRSAKDIGQQLEDNGLVLGEIETVHGWSSSGGADAAECRRREDLAYELADGAGCRYFQAIGSYEGSVAEAGEAFGALCDRAAHGLLVGVEWLPYTNIATAADAQAIVEAAGRPNGGYCADIWHHRRGANDDSMLRALPGDRVCGADGRRLARAPAGRLQAGLSRQPRPAGRGRVRLRAVRQTPAGDRRARADLTGGVLDGALGGPATEAATKAADAMRAVLAAAGT